VSDRVFNSYITIQMPGNPPEESIQHSEHSESLKSISYITTSSNKSITVLTSTQTRVYDNTLHNYDVMVTLHHTNIYTDSCKKHKG